MSIIAISGKSRSGKNTVALAWQLLEEYYSTKHANTEVCKEEVIDSVVYAIEHEFVPDTNLNHVSFAGKLKEVCAVLLGCEVEDFENESFKNCLIHEQVNGKDITVGEFLQYVGTDLFRNQVNPNIWINTMFKRYNPKCSWIITDLRFKNELIAIRKHDSNAVVIRVNSSRAKADARDTNHQSETDLDSTPEVFNYMINNDGDLTSLVTKVAEIRNACKQERKGKLIVKKKKN